MLSRTRVARLPGGFFSSLGGPLPLQSKGEAGRPGTALCAQPRWSKSLLAKAAICSFLCLSFQDVLSPSSVKNRAGWKVVDRARRVPRGDPRPFPRPCGLPPAAAPREAPGSCEPEWCVAFSSAQEHLRRRCVRVCVRVCTRVRAGARACPGLLWKPIKQVLVGKRSRIPNINR